MDGVSITRLPLGHFTAPPEDHRAGKRIVVEGYLVRHPDGTLLFDTGFGSDPDADARYRPFIRPIADVLAEAGSSIESVDVVANCHLHIDHAGQNDRFPGTPILVQAAELALARTGEHTVESAYAFDGAALQELDGEHEVFPGVTIIATPGHTAGHQSLVIDIDSGRVVLAGQSFQGATEFAMARTAWQLARDGGDESLTGLFPSWFDALEARRPDVVLFAHDKAVWRREEAWGA